MPYTLTWHPCLSTSYRKRRITNKINICKWTILINGRVNISYVTNYVLCLTEGKQWDDDDYVRRWQFSFFELLESSASQIKKFRDLNINSTNYKVHFSSNYPKTKLSEIRYPCSLYKSVHAVLSVNFCLF